MSTPLLFTVTGDWWSVGDPSLSGTTSTPSMMPVSGLVSFTPRLPKGFVAYTASLAVTTNVDCVQTVTLLGQPDGGSWVLGYGGYSTSALPYNASPSEVEVALEALTSIGTGNVNVVQGADQWAYVVTFTGTLGNQPIVAMTWDGSQLTSSVGNTVNITVEITTQGSTARSANTAIAIPARQGRIWSGQLCSIDVVDSVGVELVANDPALNLIDENIPTLIYDATFSQVTLAGGVVGTLSNFAFAAPADTTPICVTDPEFPRLTWQPPVT
jgi:hypothetical protein